MNNLHERLAKVLGYEVRYSESGEPITWHSCLYIKSETKVPVSDGWYIFAPLNDDSLVLRCLIELVNSGIYLQYDREFNTGYCIGKHANFNTPKEAIYTAYVLMREGE